jgi:hypothetical protein
MPQDDRPIYLTAKELGHGDHYCAGCGCVLTGRRVRLLELDQRTQTYHDFRGVPEDRSQGWFPFGLKCAKKKIAEARKATGEA